MLSRAQKYKAYRNKRALTMLLKEKLVILLGVIWFSLGVIFVIGFEPIEKLLICLGFFIYFYRYIYAFILNKSIYAPHTGQEIPPVPENKILRLVLFFLGIFSCTGSTFFVG